MEKTDTIQRTITVAASIERVWTAITSADELRRWFGDSADVDLRPGGSMTIGWSEYDVVANCVVEEVEPPTRFCYRWTPGGGDDGEPRHTKVCFHLTSREGGTEITVIESGLAALPDELYGRTLEENSSGWESELEDLRRLLEPEPAG